MSTHACGALREKRELNAACSLCAIEFIDEARVCLGEQLTR